MPVLFDKYENCSGCGACKQKCPQNAISMVESEYGFVIPRIDEAKCIDCGLCTKACPIINRESPLLNSDIKPMVLGLRHKSKDVLSKSTSGGAFTALVEIIHPDYVFGVVFGEGFKVIHVCKAADDVDDFRGSKYVQSDTGNTFKEAKELLCAGKRVLYTGTPCQIAGLKTYLGKEYENLYTCDLICEGASNQHIFDEFLAGLSQKYGRIKNISFRNKERNGWERSDFVVEFEAHSPYKETCHTKDVFYMNNMMFLGGARHSCYDCKFNRLPRQGDFTIGDLWGWKDIIPQWNDNKGISLLTLNSVKAHAYRELLEGVSDVCDISVEQAAKKNPNVLRSTVAPACREEYLNDVKTLSYVDLEKKYHKPRSRIRKLLSKIKFMIKG